MNCSYHSDHDWCIQTEISSIFEVRKNYDKIYANVTKMNIQSTSIKMYSAALCISFYLNVNISIQFYKYICINYCNDVVLYEFALNVFFSPKGSILRGTKDSALHHFWSSRNGASLIKLPSNLGSEYAFASKLNTQTYKMSHVDDWRIDVKTY